MRITSKYICPSEMKEMLDTMPNYYDKAYWAMLYESLTTEDALNVKCEDVDIERKVIKLNTVYLPISDELVEILKGAMEQKAFLRYTILNDGYYEAEVYDSPYIIKFVKLSNNTEPLTYEDKRSRIYYRATNLRQSGTWKPYWNEVSVRKSGLISGLKPYIDECGGDIDKAANLYKCQFRDFSTRWGFPVTMTKRICKSFLGTE